MQNSLDMRSLARILSLIAFIFPVFSGSYAFAAEPTQSQIEAAVDDLLHSEFLLVLAGVKPAGGHFLKDEETLSLANHLVHHRLLEPTKIEMRISEREFAIFDGDIHVGQKKVRKLVFVNRQAVQQRVKKPGSKEFLAKAGIDTSQSDEHITQQLISRFFGFDGLYSDPTNLISGFMFGFPLEDVRAFAEHQPGKILKAEKALNGPYDVLSYATYSEDPQSPQAQHNEAFVQAAHEAELKYRVLRMQNFSPLQIANHWSTLSSLSQSCQMAVSGSQMIIWKAE